MNTVRLGVRSSAQSFERCLKFYTSLKFKIDHRGDKMAVAYDGKFGIELDGKNNARTAIVLYSDDAALSSDSESLSLSPNGVRSILKKGIDESNIEISDANAKTDLGNFSGIGIEAVLFLEEIAYWQNIGLTIAHGEPEKMSYVILMDSFDVSLAIFNLGMCPHSFYNPSLSYFNGKEGNPKVIDRIRKLGIVPTEEITTFNEKGDVDNIIIGDPGGIHFFLFND